MTYVNTVKRSLHHRHNEPVPGLGDFWTDLVSKITGGSGDGAPVIDLPASPPDDSASSSAAVDVSGAVQDSSGGLFVSVNGVCKPTTAAMLTHYKDLQRQANRIAANIGAPKLTVDGAIGANTVALLQKIKATIVSSGMYGLPTSYDVSSCSAVATNYYAIMAALEQSADSMGAPSSVASPSAPSTFVNPVTGLKQSPGIAGSVGDLFGNMSTTEKVVIGGMAGFVAFLAIRKSKKGSARRTRRY